MHSVRQTLVLFFLKALSLSPSLSAFLFLLPILFFASSLTLGLEECISLSLCNVKGCFWICRGKIYTYIRVAMEREDEMQHCIDCWCNVCSCDVTCLMLDISHAVQEHTVGCIDE